MKLGLFHSLLTFNMAAPMDHNISDNLEDKTMDIAYARSSSDDKSIALINSMIGENVVNLKNVKETYKEYKQSLKKIEKKVTRLSLFNFCFYSGHRPVKTHANGFFFLHSRLC